MADNDRDDKPSSSVEPVEAIGDLDPYDIPRPQSPTDLHLDGNLGPEPSAASLKALEAIDPTEVRKYPDPSRLEAAIAEHEEVPVERVMVTNGSNGALDRACRISLSSDRTMVTTRPTFSLFPMFAEAAGAELRQVGWRTGSFPTEGILEAIDDSTGLVVVVTPNNPTGLTARRDAVVRVVDRAREVGALTLIDHAYVEYTDRDLTSLALEGEGIVVTRTFSKAWGMAGIRIGYAVASPSLLETLSVVGNPYPVSSLSLRVAERRLASEDVSIDEHVQTVAEHRADLRNLLASYGVETTDSEANFILPRFEDAGRVHEALADTGIAVRAFNEREGVDSGLRITVPDDGAKQERLTRALHAILESEDRSSNRSKAREKSNTEAT